MGKERLRSESRMRDVEFVPPDGGWGWVVVFAAGFSNLCTFPVLQQFGLLFRDKYHRLGITNSQTSTVINIHSAATAFVGLLNGPMFRKLSYRQVSFLGASVVFVALLFTSFSNSFPSYLASFSIMYGAGVGITASANALALNTFFKKRRRIAAGLSWTTTGLGPIFWPIVITNLLEAFGEFGTVLLMTGLSLHAVAFALLLQPVQWHVKKRNTENIKEDERPLSLEEDHKESGYFSKSSKFKNVSAFSSQYIYKEDDPIHTGYEIIDPGTPMLSKGNDGYFTTSKRSLNRLASKDNSVRNSQMNLSSAKRPSYTNLNERSRKSSTVQIPDLRIIPPTNLGYMAQESYKGKRKVSVSDFIPESEIEDCPTLKAPQDLKAEDKVVIENFDPDKAKIIAEKAKKHYDDSKKVKTPKHEDENRENKYTIRNNLSNISLKNPEDYISYGEDRKYFRDTHSNPSLKAAFRRKSNNFNYENEVLKLASLKLEQYVLESTYDNENNFIGEDHVLEAVVFETEVKENENKLSICQKIAIFFDLDLLKDLTYVNLMIGITIANFNELNFSILTPFILGDYGLTKAQVALFMSLLAGIDISVRFCIPFIAGKIGWDNSSFFLLGVMCMATGRVVLAHCQQLGVTLFVAAMIGFGKGLRTVFMALVIPTHVPLHKLPGATGLQLVTSGIVFLTFGPIVGWIKDHTNNMVTLHSLNIFTYVTALAWGYEKYNHSKKSKADGS